jgi:methyltransferase (TIGR00027 family)
MKVETIADTAHWVAYQRAIESERSDALFHDPYARLLAGERGERFAASRYGELAAGVIAQRTAVFDEFILRLVKAHEIDLVLNLAAGLDTRPYRLCLPPSLKWIEADLPDTLAYKQKLLRHEQPACRLELVGLDLSKASSRRELFVRLNQETTRALILSEGLLVYIPGDEVAQLTRDLHAQKHFHFWLTDLMSPASLRMMSEQVGQRFDSAGAPLRFAPPDGADFFRPYGWRVIDRRLAFAEMRRLKRLPSMKAGLVFLLEAIRSVKGRSMDGTILLERIPTTKEQES